MSEYRIQALKVSDEELAGWQKPGACWFSFCSTLAQVLPRGKSFVPRMLGRCLFSTKQSTMRTSRETLLAIDPQNLDIFTTIERSGGVWDEHVLKACATITKKGDVVYDIGANAGYVSLELTALFGDQISICAFEPQPTLSKLVAVSARLNNQSQISVYEVMLASAAGEGTLYVPSHAVHASAVSREEGAQEIVCPKVVLDEQIASGALPAPDVIKIDVEGAELDVLKGAAHTLRNHPPFIAFESDENTLRFGYGRKDLVDYLKSLAEYSFAYIGVEGFQPADSEVRREDIADVLAIPPGKELSGATYRSF